MPVTSHTIAGHKSAEYRPFIDGLRAVAILAVLGYHIGIPGFSGGFVGVDVFFVISGFLIIGHIAEQMRQNRFSLTDFYARRVLRLLPLLLSVLLIVSALAGVVLVTPNEYKDFGKSAAAAAVMLSNHFFLSSQGYFDTAADTKPLLHTWSLGVEAQFYVVAPWLIWILMRPAGRSIDMKLRNRLLIGGAIVISLLSFIGCMLFTDVVQNTAFFLMPCRAWEFVAGAAAGALAPHLRRMPTAAHALGLLGLMAIVACVVLYSPEIMYPSWYPLLPVLGAMLVIAAGEAIPATPVRRLLATRPLVGIGLVSYGWYLWHWPLLTFGRIHRFGVHELGPDIVIGGLLSLLLAIATYFLIERPVARNKARLLTRRRIITVGMGLAACLLVAVPGKIYQKIVSPNVTAGLSPESWPGKTSFKDLADACIIGDDKQLAATCLTNTSGKPLGILFGDSHAREAYLVLSDKAAKTGVAFVSMVKTGCPPLLGTDVLYQGQTQGCGDIWKASLKSIQDRQAKLTFAIIEANWSIYVGGANDGRPIRTLARPDKTPPDGALRDGKPAPDQYAILQSSLTDTVRSLQAMSIQRILIVAPEPLFLRDGAACLIRAHQLGQPDDICTRPQAEIEAQHLHILATLTTVAQANRAVRLIDPFTAICDGTLCRQHHNGVPIYIDDNHLTKAGNNLLFGTFAGDLAWVFGQELASP